mgnify:CR=1 FL=1
MENCKICNEDRFYKVNFNNIYLRTDSYNKNLHIYESRVCFNCGVVYQFPQITEKAVAKHYETRKKIPKDLIKKLKSSRNFMTGNTCLRQLQFGYLDMAYHDNVVDIPDVEIFEDVVLEKTRLLPKVQGGTTSCSFAHIFAGGYAAGYYSYKWAEVLEADAFEKFKEDGIFNKDTARSFRENILSKGNLEHPMELFKNFRGREPQVEPLLKRDGLLKSAKNAK